MYFVLCVLLYIVVIFLYYADGCFLNQLPYCYSFGDAKLFFKNKQANLKNKPKTGRLI